MITVNAGAHAVEFVQGSAIPHAALSPALMTALADAADYARASRAQATKKAYTSDWSHFDAWCRAEGLDALPAAPMAVGAYLSAHATTLAPSTLTRRLSAIAVAHRLAGHQLDAKHPAIADVLAGIRRVRGVAPRRAAPATTDIVRAMVAQCDTGTLIGIRDAALMLVGFAGALRRSELVGLNRQDVQIGDDGARVILRRSKGDQVGAGELVGLARLPGSPTCPVMALERWIEAAPLAEGPIFRAVDRHGKVSATRLGDRAVALVVQKLAAAADLDASVYSGHSLRAGFATAAAARDVPEWRIARHTRHKSVVVRTYIRDGALMTRTPSREVGL